MCELSTLGIDVWTVLFSRSLHNVHCRRCFSVKIFLMKNSAVFPAIYQHNLFRSPNIFSIVIKVVNKRGARRGFSSGHWHATSKRCKFSKKYFFREEKQRRLYPRVEIYEMRRGLKMFAVPSGAGLASLEHVSGIFWLIFTFHFLRIVVH